MNDNRNEDIFANRPPDEKSPEVTREILGQLSRGDIFDSNANALINVAKTVGIDVPLALQNSQNTPAIKTYIKERAVELLLGPSQ